MVGTYDKIHLGLAEREHSGRRRNCGQATLERLEPRRLLAATPVADDPHDHEFVPTPSATTATTAGVVAHTVRVAYVVPSNRTPQVDAVPKLQALVRRMQDWYRQQMTIHGFGERTFRVATEADGVTPKVDVFRVAETDAYLRGDGEDVDVGRTIWDRTQTALTKVGAPIWERGSVWFVVPEVHKLLPDGQLIGGVALGASFGSGDDAGLAMVGSATIPLADFDDLKDDGPYDGMVIPEIGPYALKQDVTFPWFEGRTIGSVASSHQGAALHELAHGFGLPHDFRNDGRQGTLMGNGLRSVRGNFLPELYPQEYTRLGYVDALALNVSRQFRPDVAYTDNDRPIINAFGQGASSLVEGNLKLSFVVSDATALSSAALRWNGDSVAQIPLSGGTFSGTFLTPYFDANQINEYTLTVFDTSGNRSDLTARITPPSGANRAPQPFMSITSPVPRVGEAVVLDAGPSYDPDSANLLFEWDLNGDGVFDTAPSPTRQYTHRFTSTATTLVGLRVSDNSGGRAVAHPIAVRPAPAVVEPTVYLSSLNWSSASSPYTGVRKDLSTSGQPLRLAGQTYAKGLGVHAPAEIVYALGGQYARFTATVGVDDAVGNGPSDGSVVFQVWGDGKLLKQSPKLTGASAGEALDVDVTGVQQLRLVTTTGGDSDYKDHADWADAKLHRAAVPGKPNVTILPRPSQVTEGAAGGFDLTRTGDLSQPLTVSLTYTGTTTAGAGGDHPVLPTSFTFAAGSGAGSISVPTFDDSAVEGTESVTATLSAGSAYSVGSPNAATLTIIDNDQPPPPTGGSSVHLSDLNWASATSPYSGVKKNLATNGNPLRIGGLTYAKGLGVHAPATLVYNVAGQYTRFTATVGVDDAVGNAVGDGSVVFEVWGDGRLLKQSTRRTGADAGETLDVDLTGVQQLGLVTTTAGDGDYKDHADWADAKLLTGTSPTPQPPRPTVAVTAIDATVGEDGLDDAVLRFTRTGSTSESLRVLLAFAGQATVGTDYAAPREVLFAPGQSTFDLRIAVVQDTAYEGNEVAAISIQPADAYVLGATAGVQITVVEDDAPPSQPPAAQTTWLGDLTPTAAIAPYGGVKRDTSVANNPLRIGGVTYTKGIGVHAHSEVTYALAGKYKRFSAAVGVDDAVGNGATDGSVVFQVWLDGRLLKSTARLTGASAAELIDLDVSGGQTLKLAATTGGLPGDNDYKDHADWADAKLTA